MTRYTQREGFSHPIQKGEIPAVLVRTSVGWVEEEARKREIDFFLHKTSGKKQSCENNTVIYIYFKNIMAQLTDNS